MKIAFVVQRYGEEVNGGAELLCRRIAEHLLKYYSIEVITTCAKDYITWRNEYSPGKDTVNGITVWRFPVDNPRDIHKFNRFSEKIFGSKRRSTEDELKWMKLQGPYSTELLGFLKNNKDNYDYFIFFTYLYCTTFFGLPIVRDKAILVPTAHDEPPIYLSIFDALFKLPRTLIYSTEEEKKFVGSKFKNENIPSEIIGVGIDLPEKIDADGFKQKYNVDNFIIYVGRIDESKGCKELFEYFLQYKNEIQSDIKLVLLGKSVMKIPKHPDIIKLGFVSEQDKFNGIKASKLLIIPSKYESLSMVIMEAWLCNNAVLVNENCEVLKGHCLKSNGGLYYKNYEELRECLNLLLSNPQLRTRMGKNGQMYVDENYGWEKIEKKYIDLLARTTQRYHPKIPPILILKLPFVQKQFFISGSQKDESVMNTLKKLNGFYDIEIMNILHQIIKPDSVCMDIGVNIGVISLELSYLAKDGKVYSFEASKNNFLYLKKNILQNNINNIEAINLGVYNERCCLDFSYVEEFSGGSFFNIPGGERDYRAITETVQCVKLDDWIKERGIEKIDFIKIDVEGSELKVIEGGGDLYFN